MIPRVLKPHFGERGRAVSESRQMWEEHPLRERAEWMLSMATVATENKGYVEMPRMSSG